MKKYAPDFEMSLLREVVKKIATDFQKYYPIE
jgi:hypothetical protein